MYGMKKTTKRAIAAVANRHRVLRWYEIQEPHP